MGRFDIMSDYDDEDDDLVQTKYQIGDVVEDDMVSSSISHQHRVGYDYIHISGQEYSFNNPEIDAYDFHVYFSKLKEFSGKTIDEMRDAHHREHYHIYTQHKWPLLREIEKKLNLKFNDATRPTTGQFGLYTTEDPDEKSPRIFFVLGRFGTIYPIFFDLYHKILS